MKKFSDDTDKNVKILLNYIIILGMFFITQIIGVGICFKFLKWSLFNVLGIMIALNFISYKIMRKLFIL